MELPFIYIIFCKYLRQINSLLRKFKNNILIILGVFLFVLFCFSVTNVKAVTNDLDITEITNYSYWEDFKTNVIKDRAYFIQQNNDGSYALFCYPCTDYINSSFVNQDTYFFLEGQLLRLRGTGQSIKHFSDYVLSPSGYRTVHNCWAGYDNFGGEVVNKDIKIYINRDLYADEDKKSLLISKSSDIVFLPPFISNTDNDLINMTNNIIVNARYYFSIRR